MQDRLSHLFSTILDILLDVRAIGLVLMVVAVGSAIYGYDKLYGEFNLLTALSDFYANVSAELGSIAITILIVDGLSRRREDKNRELELQQQLKREAGSSVHDTALTAIDILQKRGWLGRDYQSPGMKPIKDSEAVLRGANLTRADLHNVWLDHVNLSGAQLSGADLSGASLRGADLSYTKLRSRLRDANLGGANLHSADLSSADLRSTNLGNANLSSAFMHEAIMTKASLWHTNLNRASLLGADLSGADLSYTDLRGANLSNANLMGSLLSKPKLDETSVLPDRSKWNPQRNLTEFGSSLVARNGVRSHRDQNGNHISIYTLIGGVERRYQEDKGWLDDLSGQEISKIQNEQQQDGTWISTFSYPDDKLRRYHSLIGWLDDVDGHTLIEMQKISNDIIKYTYPNGKSRRFHSRVGWLADENGDAIDPEGTSVSTIKIDREIIEYIYPDGKSRRFHLKVGWQDDTHFGWLDDEDGNPIDPEGKSVSEIRLYENLEIIYTYPDGKSRRYRRFGTWRDDEHGNPTPHDGSIR